MPMTMPKPESWVLSLLFPLSWAAAAAAAAAECGELIADPASSPPRRWRRGCRARRRYEIREDISSGCTAAAAAAAAAARSGRSWWRSRPGKARGRAGAGGRHRSGAWPGVLFPEVEVAW